MTARQFSWRAVLSWAKGRPAQGSGQGTAQGPDRRDRTRPSATLSISAAGTGRCRLDPNRGIPVSTSTPSTQTALTATAVRPFRAHVPDDEIADLQRRIAATRWPSQELVADRSQGVQLATIQELTRYWATDYDWRRCEAKLNALPQFTTEIDGVDIHFIHVKSPHANAMPLIITHGWPGSVIELLEVVGPLTDPP